MKKLLVLPLLLLVSCQPIADSIQEEVDQVIVGVSNELREALENSGVTIDG